MSISDTTLSQPQMITNYHYQKKKRTPRPWMYASSESEIRDSPGRDHVMKNLSVWGLCIVALLFGSTLPVGCESKPECSQNSDCASSHESCKDGKCIHDHGQHQEEGGVITPLSDGGETNDTKKREGHHEVHHPDDAHKVDDSQQPDVTQSVPDVVQDKSSSAGELQRCNQEQKCEQGLSCIVFTKNAQSGLCLRSVPSCTGTPCGSGYQCAGVQQGGVCLLLCSAGKPCPNNLQCQHLHFTGGHGDACVP